MIGKFPDFFKSPHKITGKAQNAPVLLALSGGSDSACLLRLLSEASKAHRFKLFAAHVNHGIRGEEYGGEADRDEAFCRDICNDLGIELFVKRVDVPLLAQSSGESLETAAREARYGFFAEIMLEHGIEILATAHNADDNFETQLFNLCRGCGIEGICGIPESRPFAEAHGIIVRPILSASKGEILRFCEENDVKYVTDSTNSLDDCVRNKLRLNIIPQLKEIFGTPERSGARLALSAGEDSLFINQEAEKLISDTNAALDIESLRSAHPSVAKRAIRIAFEKQFEATLESVHVESLLRFAGEDKRGRISLPGETCAAFENGLMMFDRSDSSSKEHISYNIPLSLGINRIENTPFAILISRDDCAPPLEGYQFYSSAKINTLFPFFARNRNEGDRILDGGMHKRVKKLMCDKKVPLHDRDSLPLITDGNEVVYAPLCALSDSARASKDKFEYKIIVYKKQKI